MSAKKKKNGTIGSVLVVGGGIAGMQAALDLANSGYYVYLLEKSPAIGGVMAQLDKTFPTNDCSMCIESTKFIECDRHPNIEILTYTEVEEVAGSAGDFQVIDSTGTGHDSSSPSTCSMNVSSNPGDGTCR